MQVPTLEQPSVEAQPLPGRPYPRLSDEVSPAAFGAPLAQGIEHVSSVVTSEEARQKVQNDNLRVIDANTQLEAGRTALLYGKPGQDGTMQGGAFSLHGTDAINLPAKLLPEYQKLADGISGSLTPDQQRLFHAHVAAGSNELNFALNRYEHEESNRLADQVYKNGTNQTIQTGALGYRDPFAIGKARADLKGLVSMQGDREGWTQDEKDNQTQQILEKLHMSVIDRMLADDKPVTAKSYLDSNKGEMDAKNAWAASRTIDAHLKEKQNEQKQDIADRFNDSMQAAEMGLKNPITVSRAELDVLFPKDAQRRWDGLHSMVETGAQSREYDRMPANEVLADVKKHEPTEGGTEAAFAIRNYGILARAADRSLNARKNDPAQFALDTGQGWQPLDLRKPQDAMAQLRSRANSQAQVSAQIGMPVPLLSKSEAKQFTQTLDGTDPKNAAAMLAQLRTSLPGERSYDSLLEQIAPHSPVLAVAGALTNVPAKESAPSWYDERFAPDPKAAAGIIDGERILGGKGEEKVKGGFVLPKDEDTGSKPGLASVFRNAAGGPSNNLFQGRPQTAELYYDAFKAYYAHLAAKKGRMDGTVDQDLATQAAQAVLGTHTRFNHTDVAIPQGLDPTRFEDLARTGIGQAAKAAGLDEKFTEALKDSAGLTEISPTLGTGQYAVVDGNGRYVGDPKSGRTLTVDLGKVASPQRPSFIEGLSRATRTEGVTLQ